MAQHQRVDREKSRALLKHYFASRMPEPGDYETGLKGVRIYRRNKTIEPQAGIYSPMIVKMVQGSKHLLAGGIGYRYGETDIMVTAVDMPGSSIYCEATPAAPSLSLAIDLDKDLITQLTLEIPGGAANPPRITRGIHIQPEGDELLDAFVRLAALLQTPDKLAVLGPMIVREIHYLLLTGPDGERLRTLHTPGSRGNLVAQAISWLKQNLRQTISIAELAAMVNMAPSTFHRHFRAVTGLSPLQFHKRLRLHEAQRLMLTQMMAAGSASIQVGYDNLSQFNREYKRLFGEPPAANIRRLRAEALTIAHADFGSEMERP